MTRDELYKLPNVVGSGIGAPRRSGVRLWGREALVVYVSKKVPATDLAPEERVPKTVDGFETDVLETGVWKARGLEALERSFFFTDPYRLPLHYGMPVGHISGTAGTLCAVVRGRNTGLAYLLGANHVLAAATGGSVVNAAKGDAILFPDAATIQEQAWATLDERLLYDPATVARLASWVPLLDETQPMPVPYSSYHEVLPDGRMANLLDAAIARPIADDLLYPDPHYQSRPDQEIVKASAPTPDMVPTQIVSPTVGMEVWHVGATALPRKGRITEIDAEITYALDGRNYTFRHQITADIASNPGDSGAPLIREQDALLSLVGMLFAGSDTLSAYNPATTIRNAFNFELPAS